MADGSAPPPEFDRRYEGGNGGQAPAAAVASKGRVAPPPMMLDDRLDEPPMPIIIHRAVMQIMEKVTPVEKTGHNEFHKYDYATQVDILTMLRPLMIEAKLMVTQHAVRVDQDEGGNMVVRFKFRLQVAEESGAGEVTRYDYPGVWLGVAQDRSSKGLGDKWFSKAATAAEKYFLLKLFKIPTTGDDTDADQMDGAKDGKGQPREPADSKRENRSRTTSRANERKEKNDVPPETKAAREKFAKARDTVKEITEASEVERLAPTVMTVAKELREVSPEAALMLVNQLKAKAEELGVQLDLAAPQPTAGQKAEPPADRTTPTQQPEQKHEPVPEPGAHKAEGDPKAKARAEFCVSFKGEVKVAKSQNELTKIATQHRPALDKLRDVDRGAYDDLMRYFDDRLADFASFA